MQQRTCFLVATSCSRWAARFDWAAFTVWVIEWSRGWRVWNSHSTPVDSCNSHSVVTLREHWLSPKVAHHPLASHLSGTPQTSGRECAVLHRVTSFVTPAMLVPKPLPSSATREEAVRCTDSKEVASRGLAPGPLPGEVHHFAWVRCIDEAAARLRCTE